MSESTNQATLFTKKISVGGNQSFFVDVRISKNGRPFIQLAQSVKAKDGHSWQSNRILFFDTKTLESVMQVCREAYPILKKEESND